MVLHLVVVILFQQSTNCAIHVSGKLLPQVIIFLRNHLDEKRYVTLTNFEKLLVQYISMEKEMTSLAVVGDVEEDSEVVKSESVKDKCEESSEMVILKKQVEDTLDDIKQLVKKEL